MRVFQACAKFQEDEKDGGACVEICPPEYVYDPHEYKDILNPVVRYVFGTRCVKQCPCKFTTRSSLSLCSSLNSAPLEKKPWQPGREGLRDF